MSMARLHFSVAGLMGLVLALSVLLASLRFASETWAGVILLVTLGILTLAVLGVVYRRGATRASWLGFALVGWGYMALTAQFWWDRTVHRPELVTTTALDHLYPYLVADARWIRSAATPGSLKVLKKLDEPVSMSFANETPLEDVLKYIKSATTGPNDSGIPIYVDPVGLQKAHKTMTSPVTIDVEGVPLKITLPHMLAPLGLTCEIDHGLLLITAGTSTTDAFRRIGHCGWALLFAWLGGFAGRWFHASHDNPANGAAPGRAPAGETPQRD